MGHLHFSFGEQSLAQRLVYQMFTILTLRLHITNKSRVEQFLTIFPGIGWIVL
jgi:hypothetical protein